MYLVLILVTLLFSAAAVSGATAYGLIVWMPSPRPQGQPSSPSEEAATRKALEQDLATLAETIGERHLSGKYRQLVQAAEFLEAELRAAGHEPRRQEFSAGLDDCTVWNLEVECQGRHRELPPLVIAAHYDTVPGSPGANDNGSAVVAALALARLLPHHPPRRTVRLVFLVNEESPYYMTPEMGALQYARRCQAAGEVLFGMLSLETIGCYLDEPDTQRYPVAALGHLYPTTANFVAVVGNVASRHLVRTITAGLRAAGFPAEGIAAPRWLKDTFRSDHAAFWACGYPALMITDTANFRYAHYHTPQDTCDKIHYQKLAQLVLALRQTLIHHA